jgi:RHS repeat-associated protein
MKTLMTKTVSVTEEQPVPIPPYFYDGSILLAEKVGSQIQKIYINDDQGIVGMVRPIYDGSTLTHYQRLYYLYDSLGSVSAITGEHGLPLQNYTYSPFGTCLNVVGDPINNLQFVGRYGGYLDNDTGITYFWHRWYDSRDGRWISRDPIGTCDDKNYYRYVKNDAINKIDSTGYFLTYGNYCGPGWTSGTIYGDPDWNVRSIDDLDSCCKTHDRCYYYIDKKQKNPLQCKIDGKAPNDKSDCDRGLCSCLKGVDNTLDLYKDAYIAGASRYFKCK